jgi:regulator of protease activity HflC (stomatin/prohibitin superfamily)
MLLNFTKEETVNYVTTDVFPSREKIRTNVLKRLKAELSQIKVITPSGETMNVSIEVIDLLIDNISFRTEFTMSIEQKQIAKQDALKAEAQVEMQRQMGLQTKAKAEGEAGAVKVNADAAAYAIKVKADAVAYETQVTGDADAYKNNVVGKSLQNNPDIIPFILAQNIGPNIKVAILPNGQNFILDLESLGLNESPAGTLPEK